MVLNPLRKNLAVWLYKLNLAIQKNIVKSHPDLCHNLKIKLRNIINQDINITKPVNSLNQYNIGTAALSQKHVEKLPFGVIGKHVQKKN